MSLNLFARTDGTMSSKSIIQHKSQNRFDLSKFAISKSIGIDAKLSWRCKRIVFLNGPFPASFSFIFVFSKKLYNFAPNKCAIKVYSAGIRTHNFRIWVSSHNHQTKAPAPKEYILQK